MRPRIDGSRVKQLREHAFLTQAELAKQVHVTRATIQNIERGVQEPRPSTVRALAKALDVPARTLIVQVNDDGEA
jgi:DNA-binding XRE family transcriptional regulator